jgi:methyl-accepting chemotaxis protein
MKALDSLRLRFATVFIGFLWFNTAFLAAVAFGMHNPAALNITVAALVICGGATLFWRQDPISTATRITTSLAMASLISLLVYALQGNVYQLDMHMYFFACLTLIAGWCDLRALLAYTGLVAVHHLSVTILLPTAVFPEARTDYLRVAIHAVILLLQTGALALIIQSLTQKFSESEIAVNAANRAEAEARTLQTQQAQIEAEERVRMRAREQLSEQFVTRVQGLINGFLAAAQEVDNASQSLLSHVSEASETSRSVNDSAQAAAQNVQTVAAGTEELVASISEINHQLTHSAGITAEAVNVASATQTNVASLNEAASGIGDVIELIRAIAAQTNLLALNATIEASRAGDAGKGFAVVASEVKQLASQTAKATDDIAAKVSEIQASTRLTVDSITRISDTIAQVQDASSAISAAMQQQGGATSDIASNTHLAARGTQEVTHNIASIHAINEKTGVASDQLLALSKALTQRATNLRDEVNDFVATVNAA